MTESEAIQYTFFQMFYAKLRILCETPSSTQQYSEVPATTGWPITLHLNGSAI